MAEAAAQSMHTAAAKVNPTGTNNMLPSSTALASCTSSSGTVRPRVNPKMKHLMRSQALRESTSPPRAPDDTVPAIIARTSKAAPKIVGSVSTLKVQDNEFSHQMCHANVLQTRIHDPTQAAVSDMTSTPALLDLEFPKLAYPKSKVAQITPECKSILASNIGSSTDKGKSLVLEAAQCGSEEQRSSNKNYNNSTQTTGKSDCIGSSTDNPEYFGENSPIQTATGTERHAKSRSQSGSASNSGFVGLKPRMKSLGQSTSNEEVMSASSLSRDDSIEQYTDSNGVDLLQFFKETLNKNTKDRNMLIRIERDLLALVMDRSRSTVKFPPTSSYNRMLIHRVAAFFGMEHNVDHTQQCVIAGISKATRVPEVRFRSLLRGDEPNKSILKRESKSFEEFRHGLQRSGSGSGGIGSEPSDYRSEMLHRKAKSFEERDEEYDRVKWRIFKESTTAAEPKSTDVASGGDCSETANRSSAHCWPRLGGSDSSEFDGLLESMRGKKSSKGSRLLKVHSLSVDAKPQSSRPPVTKSNSFGGYGPVSAVHRGHQYPDHQPHHRHIGKQDFLSTSWRLSSSSGYKTQSQSIRSDSVTPSPTEYESAGDHTPEPTHHASGESSATSVVWAVTDMAAVPLGSVLINPQTLQPFINRDGSTYHFDPDNLPVSCSTVRNTGHSHYSVDTVDKIAANTACTTACDDDDYLDVNAEELECCIEPQRNDQQECLDDYSSANCENQSIDQSLDTGGIPNIVMSYELTNIDQEVGDKSITDNDEIPEQNHSIIPDVSRPIADMEDSEKYTISSGGINYYPTLSNAEGYSESGEQSTTYSSTDADVVSEQFILPVYGIAALTPPQQQHNQSHQIETLNQQQPPGLLLQPHNLSTGIGVHAASASNLSNHTFPIVYPTPTAAVHPHIMSNATAVHHMVYAPSPYDSVIPPSNPQYYTIPMGYTYTCHDPAYANFWSHPNYYMPQATAAPGSIAIDPTNAVAYNHSHQTPHQSNTKFHHPMYLTSESDAYVLASKSGSPSIQQHPHQQQSHQPPHHHQSCQHQPQSQQHQQHNHSTTASVISAAPYNPPYAGATADAGLSYVVTAANVTNNGADSGTLLKGVYPIPQPIYTNVVHQAYYQEQQHQQYPYHKYQQHQPHQQLQQWFGSSPIAYRADLQTSTDAVIQSTFNDVRPKSSPQPSPLTSSIALASVSPPPASPPTNVRSVRTDTGAAYPLPYQKHHNTHEHSNVFEPNIRYHNHHVSERPGLYSEMNRQIDASTSHGSVNRQLQCHNNTYANSVPHAANNGVHSRTRWRSDDYNHQLSNAKHQCAPSTSGYGNHNNINHLHKRIAAVATVTTASTTLSDTIPSDPATPNSPNNAHHTSFFQAPPTDAVTSAPLAPVAVSSSFNQTALRHYHQPNNRHNPNQHHRPAGYRHQVVPLISIRHVNNAVSTGQFKYRLAGSSTTSKLPQPMSGGVGGCRSRTFNSSSASPIGGSSEMQTTSHSSPSNFAKSTEYTGHIAYTRTSNRSLCTSAAQAQESAAPATTIPEAPTSSARLASTVSRVCSGGGELMAVTKQHQTYQYRTSATMAASYDGGVKLGQSYFAQNIRVRPPPPPPPPSALAYDGLFLVQPSLSIGTQHYHHPRPRTRMFHTNDVRPTTSLHLSEMHPSLNIMLSAPRPINPRASMIRRNMHP